MKKLMTAVKNFAQDEEGVTAIEYGLLAALIALAIALTVRGLGTDLNTLFGRIRTCLGGGAC